MQHARLHKHIEDAAAHPLALHGNLFREIDLHHSWTPRINDVKRGAPYIGLAAPATNGAADLAATLHQHFRPHLARHRAFAPDDGCNRRRLARLHMLDEFFVQILHATVSLVFLSPGSSDAPCGCPVRLHVYYRSRRHPQGASLLAFILTCNYSYHNRHEQLSAIISLDGKLIL